MRIRSAILLATGVLALAGCALLTDLSGLSGGPDPCDGGACADGSGALDASGDASGGGGEGGADGGDAACVPTDSVDPSLLSDAVGLALGHSSSCALRSNGTVACWGDNGEGELGVLGGDRATAGTVPGLSRIVAITAGLRFECALDADGHVWCWGANNEGQLGSAPDSAFHSPTMLKTTGGTPLSNVTAISAGDEHVCAIVNGAVWCWGENATLQLGRTTGSSLPAAIAMDLANPVEVASSGTSSCAIADGPSPGTKALYCWGANDNDQLATTGADSAALHIIPVSLAAAGSYPVLAAGHGHICARDNKDGLFCWGENDFGQLGPNIPPGASPVPQAIDAFGQVRTAAAGDDFTCAIAHDGSTRCLGEDTSSQLGNGTVDFVPDSGLAPPHTMATPVSNLSAANRIAAGTAHACVILARSCPDAPGPVKCWGLNDRGQLGNGLVKATKVPVAVLAP
jgi:alpha-tubulin suppressor-like RCC1 family protein